MDNAEFNDAQAEAIKTIIEESILGIEQITDIVLPKVIQVLKVRDDSKWIQAACSLIDVVSLESLLSQVFDHHHHH